MEEINNQILNLKGQIFEIIMEVVEEPEQM